MTRYLAVALAGLAMVGCGASTKSAPAGATPPAGGTTSPGGGTNGGGGSIDNGGGTSGGGSAALKVGIALPTEISALPAKGSSTQAQSQTLRRAFRSASATAELPADSDYAQARTMKFVDEQALSQFSIFNTIFKALAETHYADPENVDQGPYGCMVTWDDKGGSSTGKQLVPWVVDSKLTADASGAPVNQVKVWMQMNMGDGQMHVIKIDLDIYAAPTQRADGSYADYGVWNINAKFDESAFGYFAASSTRDADGHSVIKLHEVDPGDGGGGGGQMASRETKGILIRADASGYGIVSYPNQDCRDGVCTTGNVTASYAYNATHVALQSGTDPIVYKDRTAAVDIVNRYGLYDADTGEDVTKSHSFGFPIKYVDGAGLQHWGYYGAWQGRHQLGYDGMHSIPAGATVTRADLPPNAPVQSFTASDPYVGTLVKRTLVPGDIQGIKGAIVQTWVNKNFSLAYDGANWLTCPPGEGVMLFGGAPSCHAFSPTGPGPSTGSPTVFADFETLVLNPNDMQRQVMINYNPPPPPCNGPGPCQPPQPSQPQMLVYVSGQGFFHTDWQPSPGPQTQPTSNGIAFVPSAGDQLWVNIGGPLYISFDGTSFLRKTVLSQNQNNFMPNFDPSGDVPYTLDLNFEYYFNTPGVNYVVKRTDASTYDVKVELQSVANPNNAGTFVPTGTVFRQQWDSSACSTTCGQQSTYAFDGDTMKLVYVCVGTQDQNANGKHPGDEVTTGQWGLVAYDSQCTTTHTQYNWDYPQGQNQGNFGAQQYLKRGDGSLIILEDPIRLAPTQLPNHHGDVLTLSLQFDGNWVNGLPDIYNELMNNSWALTQAIADKVVVIPAGTDVVDANASSKHYVFKPLQMNEYLPVIDNPGDVDVSEALGLDLSTVPTFVDAHLSTLPEVPLKYSEGKLIQ
jgi:hypothetical protein